MAGRPHQGEELRSRYISISLKVSSTLLIAIDWGDFVSFTRHMKRKAAELNVDLLLVDTGDLHDGKIFFYCGTCHAFGIAL